MAALGLRGKSLLALLLTCLLAFVFAGFIGREALLGVQNRFGEAYARNVVQLNRERLFAPVSRELALAQRLAASQLTLAWLNDERNPTKRETFFKEAAGYQQALGDHAYFAASARSNSYYSNGPDQAPSETPRYEMSPDNPRDEWFFQTLQANAPYALNVDRSVVTGELKVWFNVQVRDGDRRLGLVGSGIGLQAFLDDFIESHKVGVESMVLDAFGSILVHPNQNLVTLNAETARGRSLSTNILGLLDDLSAASVVRQAMAESRDSPGSVATVRVTLDGAPRLLALSWIPELQWFVASAVDLSTAQVVEVRPLLPAIGLFLVLFLLLIGGGAWLVEKRVLKPLRQLRRSAQALAAGQYDAPLPLHRQDEIGELSAAFGAMAQKVRSHTSELENRVRERTRDLEQANRDMAAAHKKIDDSIDYASLIQRSILPNRQLVSAMGDRHAVLWRPRDVVGGDFYVYRADDHGCLFGVVDCAGHGVPGALMTMLAHAAIDQALGSTGLADPAAALARTDAIVRSMLKEEDDAHALATNMDIGLAYVDLKRRKVHYSGAKIALYYCDGEDVHEVKAARRAIGDKRVGEYHNTSIDLRSGRTFYMTTDGFLDQAGGDQGYGFGNSRFASMIREHARRPLAEQGEAFSLALARYQGEFPQRDDITMLCFRFD
ncbi:biofilm regulation protein phosphatase SiaA [Stutzerimonas stutzeri]|uniref:biofilm regulation protein phosphatase SiaA n=1 Tax=Stutzerimonas stutzeri TaxID=316 RepID=UPI00066AE0FE|nr:biofilm regulation protein phosphatase SiaA [Stutzerimonas stutzeri]MBK3804680.1 SpoIIE family protein phosphatase [Stutzerimonas stutzeri]MBK3850680.1 SpoIIE family protein phosphatase [Stutzerimonas stutzeri]MDH0425846.1 biofilm regulation protein phosphatase SiaA [Stutzerimonas stutzeri]RRW21721.1 HAMP domain-containing protein [Stutzerimonas stutzeri]RRW48498.1 HAMP domain-containing protein [Stutzerimonas stutzeri]